MFPINPKAVCATWCVLMACVSEQAAATPSGDRLEAETAVRLREFEKNHDRGGPRRPMSAEMRAIKPSQIENLTSENLAKMTVENPLLKRSYAEVFLRDMGQIEPLEPPQQLALADMRRRGESVSPMLLKLIAEHQENIIEGAILGGIEHLDTVRIEPFLEYARKLLRERAKTMTSYSAGVASYVVEQHGTKEDEALLEWVLKERPYVASDLTKALKILKARLNHESGPRPERREISSSNAGSGAHPTVEAEDHSQDRVSATSPTKPWLIGGMIVVALVGLYSFLRKRRLENLC